MDFLRRPILVIFIFCLSTLGVKKVEGKQIYVAIDGTDDARGTLEQPFASLHRAITEIRQIHQSQPKTGVTIIIGNGIYPIRQPLTLAAEVSGTAEHPIRFVAQSPGEVRLIGGEIVTNFELVTDPQVLDRLDPTVHGKVVQADLAALGITDFGSVNGRGLELFFNQQPMPISRWPNEGFVKIADLVGGDPVDVRGTKGDRIGKFYYHGDRPRRWQQEKEAWLHGYWFWDWSDQQHAVESIDINNRIISVRPPYHGYGYRQGQWFYAFNLLSEIDRPGEWYLDRQSGILYFYPPLENGTAIVSVTSNAASLENVKHVSFENLTVEAFRADAIRLQNCSHNRIVGCTIRNVGSWAVQVKGGIDNWVIGGDRPKLESAGHLADNNHIHHYSRWKRMYQPAISINGVGNRATHNLIHHAPHMAIGFSGNEHLIEFNEIHHVCQESNDAGAIYTGRDWTMRGTIIRHNFLHHINGFEGRGCVGVYLDDMFCGTLIFGNLFYKVTRAAFIGGGRDGTVENNIFVDCEPALHIDARATGWANYHVDTTMKDRLFAMPFQESRWADHYPQLLTLWQDDPAAPKGNVVARNISQGGRWDGVRDEARPFIHFEDNLIDQLTETVGGDAPTDFRISDQLLLQKINFRSIPTEQIGLRRD